MYANITSHNVKTRGVSSGNIFQYLDKENQKIRESAAGREEYFFNQSFNPYDENDPNSKISVEVATAQIDANRGTLNNKLSNFYMLNISPSQQEQEHMLQLAEQELERRGLNYEELKENPEALSFYYEQRDEMMKMQMKLYTKEVMNEYARLMDREIYAYQDKLPNPAERKEMQPEVEKRYEAYLKEQGIKKLHKSTENMVLKIKEATELENGSKFIIEQERGKEISLFVPNQKIKLVTENTLIVDKLYYESKLAEQETREQGLLDKDKRKEIEAEIVERRTDAVLIATTPEDYGKEVRFWANKTEVQELDGGKVSLQEYRAKQIIKNAVEWDKEQKTLLEIEFERLEVKDIKPKEGEKIEKGDKMYIFYQRQEGLEEPIKFSFKQSELHIEEGRGYVERYKLEHRLEQAKEKAIEQEHASAKERIKNEVWQEKGFDTTKRKITGEDLLYFAKVETERAYKHTNKAVLRNRETLKEIAEEEAKENPDIAKINLLKSKLELDRHTGEVIKEGAVKGGLNYHTHVIVSRHDRTSIYARDKVSMSPNANNKEGRLGNGAKIGFHRDEFFKSMERVFDERFEYERPQQERYERRNELSKSAKEAQHRVESMIKNKIKQEIYKHTGINTIRQKLDPRQKIRNAIIPIPLPTSFPTSKIDLIIKAVKLAKNLVVDKGAHY